MATDEIDQEKRRFLVIATSIMGSIGAAFAAIPFISSWWPSAKAQAAGAPVEADISKLSYGEQMIVEWRGKPVWIVRRNKAALDILPKNEDRLRDPQSVVEQQPIYARNRYRSINPEYLVLVGICTHLGCSPKYLPDLGELGPAWPGGFYCPCHGSTFDLAGRVFKAVPAPINLEVPPYKFVNKNTILIGVDEEA